MIRLLICLLIFITIFSGKVMSAALILSYSPSAIPNVTAPALTNAQWRWLGHKRELVVALYGLSRPPLVRRDATHRITGYLPDFTWAAARSMGVTLKLINFDTAAEAFAALDEHKVDMVVNYAGDKLPAGLGPLNKVPFADAYPVIVTREENRFSEHSSQRPESEYQSPLQLLAALDEGKLSSVTLPAGEAYYLTERNYVNSLRITQLASEPMNAYQFVLRHDDTLLSGALQSAIEHLKSSPAGEILATRWDQSNLTRFVSAPLDLTPEETSWLKTHPEVTVAFSGVNAPYFIREQNGKHSGIGPEVLSLISLRTGLRFNYKEVGDSRDLADAMNGGKAVMTAPLIWSSERSRSMLLTMPFMFNPYVMVMRKDGTDNPQRAALVEGQDASHWFIHAYPEAQITFTGNSGLAMQWVAEGKVDATLNTLISARYLLEGLYQDKLILRQGLPLQNAPIVFGVRRADPELLGILNKTLAQLPPDLITNILTHWQSTPGVRFDTWKIYRGEFYIGAAGALLLLSITALWAVILHRQVQRTRHAKTLLRQQIAFRDRLISGPPRPVYVASAGGQIIHKNTAFSLYFDAETAPLLELSLFDSRHPLYEVWQRCMESPPSWNTPIEDDFTLTDSAGRQRHIRHWMTSFMEEDDKTEGYIGGWQDVTAYLNMQADLSQARIQAEEASKSKSRFLATMSHEIRTPLSAIIGLLELQVQEKRADIELITTAHESSLSLLALIGDILDIARIESGKVTITPRWSTVNAIARPVVQAFSGLARQKGLRLNLQLPDEDIEIYADDHRLRQVLANLVGNAVKFTLQGEVNVCVRLSAGENAQLRLEVADTGPGIPKKDQARLFAPFEQAAEPGAGGSGLGLAICREISTLMGGLLTLDSTPGKGAVFTLMLPVKIRQPQRVDATKEQTAHTAKRKGLHILIVDDHPANRLLLSRQLKLLGHQATEADNGQTGLTAWRIHKPDVIITDCSMPEMDGPEMTRRIRDEDAKVVIIGITANAQESENARCLAAGMNACLFRPVEISRLAETINTWSPAPEAASEAIEGKLSDWIDLNALEAFLPDSPDAVRQFIDTAIHETERDLKQARDAIQANDLIAARRIFHRIAGTLRVTGISRLGEQCALLEELTEMEEESAIILHHIAAAELTLAQFSHVFSHACSEE